MITKTTLKSILGGVLFLSFILISCNDEKKVDSVKIETVTDTTGKGPKDTGITKPVVEVNN